MSGGSYGYLYSTFVSDLHDRSSNLREMADDLMAEWPQSKAAHDTLAFVELFDLFDEILEVKKKKLEDVWHAQEWWRSNDYSQEQVTQAIWDYEHPKPDELREPT